MSNIGHAISEWVIDWKDIFELVTKEAAAFDEIINDNILHFANDAQEVFALAYWSDDWSDFEDAEEVKQAYRDLCAAFYMATMVGDTGLILGIDFLGDDFSSDDTIGGSYLWCVLGVTQRTPAGEKLGDKISLKAWVLYG